MQQMNQQQQQLLQLLMGQNLLTQLNQTALMQQPQNAFFNPQQLNLAAQLGAQKQNMNQLQNNN